MFNLDPIPIPEWTWLGLWNYIQNHTDYFIILLIIALNLLAILWYFLSTLVMHALKRKRDAKSHAVREETEDILSQFIGDEENMDHYARECKRVFDNNPSNRHELFDVFLSFLNLVQGQSFRALQELLQRSGLADELVKKLGKPDHPHLLLFMHVASEAEIPSSKQAFKKLLKHKEREVRFQALCALMEVFQFNALEYIYEVGFKINEWEEMILLEKILAYPGRNTLNLSLYLKSDNEQLVRLSIRIARNTNRYDLENELKELLHHPNPSIRHRSYLAIGTLLMNDLEEEITSSYHSETLQNKKAILRALEDIGTTKSYPLLHEILTEVKGEVTVPAAKALYSIGGETAFEPLLAENDTMLKIIQHIQDPLLA